MLKKQLSDILNFASQTLPFLIVTATFIGIAYTYGHAYAPFHGDESFDLIRLNCYNLH